MAPPPLQPPDATPFGLRLPQLTPRPSARGASLLIATVALMGGVWAVATTVATTIATSALLIVVALLVLLRLRAARAVRRAGLEERLRASADELHASRARIFSAGSEERRRIERDLHDSGQNRLVALRIKLELAADEARAEGASEQLRARLEALGEEAQDALEAIRAIAHGIYPPLLATGGLLPALEAEAQGAARPAAVDVATTIPRSSPEAEAAVYHCCLEALQNACKHAGPRARATVRLACDGGWIDFAVADDGPGFGAAVVRDGTGLTHMRDRIHAVGGTVEFATAEGGGAVVHGRAPWPSRAPRAEVWG